MENTFETRLTSPSDKSVSPLIEALSENLKERFNSDGKNSFQFWDENDPKYIFVSLSHNNECVGCGAIRPINEITGEVKRMYAKYRAMGIGSAVLAALEHEAGKAGYKQLWLETRDKNIEACNFYQKHGYKRIKNYGNYANRPEAACFGKTLIN
ncbi:MAG: GNAT family N-acetyltransferase [Ferruginibacter sp.]|nr:GNAT family N-acetyltransferase [Ferruginibacter sp.]